MILLKKPAEIELLWEGGQKLQKILSHLISLVKPGMTGEKLDEIARGLFKKEGGEPSFLDYDNFPASICVSVNDVVVHGVPDSTPFKDGDIVSVDAGFFYKGFYTDAAATVPVGKITPKEKELILTTNLALKKAIANMAPNKPLSIIGKTIEKIAIKKGFGIVKDLVGHGVGYAVHEEPDVANFFRASDKILLKPGIVLAIEPMLTLGSGEVVFTEKHAVLTKDGSKSAHFEKTVALTETGVLILTQFEAESFYLGSLLCP